MTTKPLTGNALKKIWAAEFAAEAKQNGYSMIGDYAYRVLGEFVQIVTLMVYRSPAKELRCSWHGAAKPMAVDPILWDALFPELDLGSERKRRSLRVNGAFTVSAHTYESGSHVLDTAAATPDAAQDYAREVVRTVLDELDSGGAEFFRMTPDLGAFDATLATREHLLHALVLIAEAHVTQAVSSLVDRLAVGDAGNMFSGGMGVHEALVRRYSTDADELLADAARRLADRRAAQTYSGVPTRLESVPARVRVKGL